jgi:hypothetical protein
MYHEDGIAVRLEARGNDIKEWTYPSGQDPADPEQNDTRAIISAKFNTHFTVVLEVTEDFRRLSTEGLKLIVAIGHNQQIPGDLDDVQAWHIPLNAYFKNRFKISKQWSWGGGSYETLIEELVIPAPEGRSNHPCVLSPHADINSSLRVRRCAEQRLGHDAQCSQRMHHHLRLTWKTYRRNRL